MSWADLGPADLPDGGMRDAVVGSTHLGIARSGELWVAFDVWCTHADCLLTEGLLEDAAVRCACHGALFALPTGDVLEGPAVAPLRTYPTRVVEGRVEADLA